MPEEVVFEDQRYGEPEPQGVSGLRGLVIRWGLAKDEAQATRALLVIAIVALILAIAVPLVSGAGAAKPLPWTPPPANDIPPTL